MRSWAVFFLLISASVAVAADADPVFSRMSGKWTGEGERRALFSGRLTRITAKVESWIDGDFLYSKNEVTELEEGAAQPRSYIRTYWLHGKTAEPGKYELGYGTSKLAFPSALGVWDESTQSLSVKQTIGTVLIESRTEFSSEGSTYFETGYQGGSKLSETQIRYRKALSAPEGAR